MPGQKWEKPTETISYPVDLLKRLKNWQYKEHMYEGVITRLNNACCKDKSTRTALLISHSKVTAVMTPSTPEKWRLIPGKEWKTESGNLGKWSTTDGRDPILKTADWVEVPECSSYWASTTQAARLHSPGRRSEDPFLETEAQEERYQDTDTGVTRKRPYQESLPSKSLILKASHQLFTPRSLQYEQNM